MVIKTQRTRRRIRLGCEEAKETVHCRSPGTSDASYGVADSDDFGILVSALKPLLVVVHPVIIASLTTGLVFN
jgi:hypothetical protein